MSMLATTRGSGTTGLLEQPPARSLTRPQPAGPDTVPSAPTDFETRNTMTTTASARGAPAPARVVARTAEAVPPTPSEIVAATPAATPVRSWFHRISDIAFRMDACTKITAAHRDAWRDVMR